MSSFDGMCALVTGSASGLGAATAVALARGGARVIVNYSEWGRLDALVNNASATKHVANPADLDALSAEDFHRIYGVNTIGPYQMVRAARPLLEAGARAAERASSVVNVSSVAALNATGSSLAYTASKAALNTMTLSLARALAPLIRVNAVCPGYMDTPWWVNGVGQEAADKLRALVKSAVPLRVASKPEDIAEVVTFLAGPASRHMTGAIVPADAGVLLLVPVAATDARR